MIPTLLNRLLWRCSLLFVLILATFGTLTPEAIALLRQHHDAPGVLRYHSQVSIKDGLGYAWQVVLFKVVKPGQPKDIHLRLVGFPGTVQFVHPLPLEILTTQGQLLTASDIYIESSPAPNVGEYQFADVLLKLKTLNSLKLYLPLEKDHRLVLKIPKEIVTEWHWLINDFD
ncbi:MULTISPECIES: DUF3122 domain-containing protein [Nostocales]|uniref:DUF3122 domain-containing protein n=3 Tax=Nostocales TaxID=1161 RepID=A0A0C1RN07_9CYAN|nr:DUF3122 domain-containing protein [Tolypothrix bouteillei]KAF3887620.1 DUF3122 domain-containing protein [Tolypothrix bouteillei VB521301]